MPEQIITVYCFFDELQKALGHKDDVRAQITIAEVMTVAVVAAHGFTGNQQAALNHMVSHKYIAPLSKSRFNRRLHQIPESYWQFALFVLAQIRQKTNPREEYIVDSFPVPVCRNIRIRRCSIYKDKVFHGYCASKKEYFYGLKVCLITTASGDPVEMTLVPGSTHDMTALKSMELSLLPEGSRLYADKGFLDHAFETALQEELGIELVAPRRKNMKDQLDGCLQYICGVVRKRVETTFSLLNEHFARSIHAVRPRGFEIKIIATILAYAIV